jgi:DNA-binding transcriptional ArsR family regulator
LARATQLDKVSPEALTSLRIGDERLDRRAPPLLHLSVNLPVGEIVAADPLSLTFAALAHPARRAILARLSLGQTSVQELSKPLKLSGPAMTKHLKSLERGGLISRSREAQWRPCKLEAAPIENVTNWIGELTASTERSLDRLDAYLQTLQSRSGPTGMDGE